MFLSFSLCLSGWLHNAASFDKIAPLLDKSMWLTTAICKIYSSQNILNVTASIYATMQ